ncbi:MAG: hypothetical protein RIC35_04535 [Marinoscillum sp.]
MTVKVSYQTLQLPPPFAFAYTLELDFKASELHIKYNLEFLNRDDITLEEIEEEGYSKDDDFSWSGTLSKVWVESLKNDLQNIDLEDESEDFNIYLHVEIDNDQSGLAVMAEDWDYRLQELIQAIYEKAGIEDKLKMKIIHLDGSTREFYELEGSFEERNGKVNNRLIEWDDMHQLMSDIYTIDFEGESVEKPNENGLWIDPDGQSGYQHFETQAGPMSNKIKKRILDGLS